MNIKNLSKIMCISCLIIHVDYSSASFMNMISRVLSSANVGGLIRPATQCVSRHLPATVLVTACVVGAATLTLPSVRTGIRRSFINACIAMAKFSCKPKLFNIAKWFGADLNALDRDNTTLLYRAAQSNNVQLFNALYAAGARCDLNVLDAAGKTLLCRTVESECTPMAQALLEAGADPNLNDRSGNAPIHYATLNGNREMIELLARYNADMDALGTFDNENGSCTPLGRAILSGNLDVMRALLRAGANPEVPFLKNFTLLPLGQAIERRNIGAVRLLCEHDTQTNRRERFLRTVRNIGMPTYGTALHEAADFANRPPNGDAIVQFLLEQDGRQFINVKNEHGETPLHIAAAHKFRDASLMLVQNGANLEIRDNKGKTPLEACANTELREQLVHEAAQRAAAQQE